MCRNSKVIKDFPSELALLQEVVRNNAYLLLDILGNLNVCDCVKEAANDGLLVIVEELCLGTQPQEVDEDDEED